MKRARALAFATIIVGLLAPLAARAEQGSVSGQDAASPAGSAPSLATPEPPAPASGPAPAAPVPGPPLPDAPPSTARPAPLPGPPPASGAPRVVLSPGEALVHVAVSHRDAWLETRSAIDGGEFVRTCAAPCDIKLPVDGREARVVAPGMTTSNAFRFDAGAGVANVRVEGGSATARRVGIITLVAGIPVALAGMGLFAHGRVKDQSSVEVAGVVGLVTGGLSVAISLPLLLKGTTHVKNAKGSLIALAPFSPAL